MESDYLVLSFLFAREIKSVRILAFHWRIIHNALFTEHRLHLMGMSDGICHFCKRETETVSQLF